MVKKNNYKIKGLILVFMLMLGLIISVSCLITSKNFDVKADSNNYDIDYYTDSDYLINDNTKTIFDYCSGDNPLHATKNSCNFLQNFI